MRALLALLLVARVAAAQACAECAACEQALNKETLEEAKREFEKLDRRLAKIAEKEKTLKPETLASVKRARKDAYEGNAFGRTIVPLFVALAQLHGEALAQQRKAAPNSKAVWVLAKTSGLFRAMALAMDTKAFEKMPKRGSESAASVRKALDAAKRALNTDAEKAALIRLVAGSNVLEEHCPRYGAVAEGLENLRDAMQELAEEFHLLHGKDCAVAGVAARDAALRAALKLMADWGKQGQAMWDVAEMLADDGEEVEDIELELGRPGVLDGIKRQFAELRKMFADGATKERELRQELLEQIRAARRLVFEESSFGRTVVPLLTASALLFEEALAKSDKSKPSTVLIKESAGLYRAMALSVDARAFERMPASGKECAAAAQDLIEAAKRSLKAEGAKAEALKRMKAERFLTENTPRHRPLGEALDLQGELGDGLAMLVGAGRKNESLKQALQLLHDWFELARELPDAD